jgi:hypothetical protein
MNEEIPRDYLVHWIAAIDNKKFREQLQAAFPGTVAADEGPAALFWTTEEIKDVWDEKCFVFFTNYRIAVGKLRGFVDSGYCSVFSRESLSHIEVGESDYVEYRGAVSPKQTNFLTIRLCFLDGQRIDRHINMGSTESDYNKRITSEMAALQRLANLGYSVSEGAGWSASGGFTTYQGIGVGMWLD